MYISLVIMKNKNIYISYWFLLITLLVGLMIVVGGLTRLTDSGLSITQWNLISGIIPPLSIADWNYSFNLYKKIPEFKLLNSSMTLEQFKIIYWWEYIHRILGRIIGILYIIPLIYFTLKKRLSKNNIISLYSIFILICLQGFIGWYMVKSGLTERTDVSHYRLAIHLILAFIILISLRWSYLDFNNTINKKRIIKLPYNLPILFILLLLIQLFIGAMVSGLDAGQIYQSWPLMNGSYFPGDSSLNELLRLDFFDDPSLVQFIHRNIAYFIFLIFIFIIMIVFKNNTLIYLRKTSLTTFVFLLFQIILGILTVVSGAQIFFASLHQICSIFLILAALSLVYKNFKIN